MFNDTERHPSYGMLSFSRVNGGDPNLFGSSVLHDNKIQLVLKEGKVSRELNNDWYFGGRTLFEVEMSYTQFAELISAMNVGDGIPVTIRYTSENGHIDGIKNTDKRSQFLQEFSEKNDESADEAKELIRKVSEIFNAKRQIKAKEKEEIIEHLTKLYNAISSHNTFMLKQFNESMEKITTEAKGEVEAFVENKMHSLALEAMAKKETIDQIATEAPKQMIEMTE